LTRSAVGLLESLNCPAYKIASFEVCDDPLLVAVGATGRPVLVSTGVATIDDIEDTLRVLRGAGSGEVALLHCISSYPAEAAGHESSGDGPAGLVELPCRLIRP